MADALALDAVVKRFGDQAVVDGVTLLVRPGEMVCLLGPSGCGKSTTLRLVAGFESLDAGRVRLGGADVSRLPPEKRDIGFMFQSYALFPHMTVAANVGFGLRMRGVPRARRAAAVEEALALVRLEGLADRLPRQLSGGQQQRVALARAIAFRPRLLLLDEPLSNLDAGLRETLRDEIRRVQKDTGLTALFVTHDQSEALAIADRVAIMRAGKVVQFDTPAAVYARPADAFVAGFIGQANLLPGVVEAVRENAVTVRMATGERLDGSGQGLAAGAAVLAVVKADRVKLHRTGPDAAAGGLPARVEAAVFTGPTRHYTLATDAGTRLIAVASSAEAPPLAPGEGVFASWSPADCVVIA
ncbi:MAG: ABC transporter ATP-binding protein [Janthinobacterium lividum]